MTVADVAAGARTDKAAQRIRADRLLVTRAISLEHLSFTPSYFSVAFVHISNILVICTDFIV